MDCERRLALSAVEQELVCSLECVIYFYIIIPYMYMYEVIKKCRYHHNSVRKGHALPSAFQFMLTVAKCLM